MTRSVEIPEAAVEAVAGHFYTMQSKIAWSQIDPNSSVALNYKRWAAEALEAAALPYLAPAGDGGLREAVKQLRMYCGLQMDEPDASEDEQVAYDDIAIQLAKILRDHPAAPAVPQPVDRERGLREALEKLADDAVPLNGVEWVSAARLRDLLAAHSAAPAVPHGPYTPEETK